MAVKASNWQAASTVGLVLTGVALAVTLLGGWIASRDSVAMTDQKKLQSSLESLHSYAAETQFLFHEYEAGRATGTFTQVSAEKLHMAASDLADQLKTKPAEKDVEKKTLATEEQASHLGEVLADFSKLPNKPVTKQLESQLQDIQSKVKDLEDQK